MAAELASMHVVFDGASCAYHGPDQLLAGEAIVKVERSPGAEDVAFLVPRLVDESVGFDEVRDWAAVHPAQAVPPFIDWRGEIVYLTDDARHEAFAITLEPGRYLVTCNTAPGGTDRAHPAAVLSVMSE